MLLLLNRGGGGDVGVGQYKIGWICCIAELMGEFFTLPIVGILFNNDSVRKEPGLLEMMEFSRYMCIPYHAWALEHYFGSG